MSAIEKPDFFNKSSNDVKAVAERELFKEQLERVEISSIINEFEVEREMKKRMTMKNVVKYRESDLNSFERRKK